MPKGPFLDTVSTVSHVSSRYRCYGNGAADSKPI